MYSITLFFQTFKRTTHCLQCPVRCSPLTSFQFRLIFRINQVLGFVTPVREMASPLTQKSRTAHLVLTVRTPLSQHFPLGHSRPFHSTQLALPAHLSTQALPAYLTASQLAALSAAHNQSVPLALSSSTAIGHSRPSSMATHSADPWERLLLTAVQSPLLIVAAYDFACRHVTKEGRRPSLRKAAVNTPTSHLHCGRKTGSSWGCSQIPPVHRALRGLHLLPRNT